jgi:hypothetical protein
MAGLVWLGLLVGLFGWSCWLVLLVGLVGWACWLAHTFERICSPNTHHRIGTHLSSRHKQSTRAEGHTRQSLVSIVLFAAVAQYLLRVALGIVQHDAATGGVGHQMVVVWMLCDTTRTVDGIANHMHKIDTKTSHCSQHNRTQQNERASKREQRRTMRRMATEARM